MFMGKKKTAHRIWVWRGVKWKDWGIIEVSLKQHQQKVIYFSWAMY